MWGGVREAAHQQLSRLSSFAPRKDVLWRSERRHSLMRLPLSECPYFFAVSITNFLPPSPFNESSWN